MSYPTECPICNKVLSFLNLESKIPYGYCPGKNDDSGESHFYFHLSKRPKLDGEFVINSYEIIIGEPSSPSALYFVSDQIDSYSKLENWISGKLIYFDPVYYPYNKDHVFKFIDRLIKLKVFI